MTTRRESLLGDMSEHDPSVIFQARSAYSILTKFVNEAHNQENRKRVPVVCRVVDENDRNKEEVIEQLHALLHGGTGRTTIDVDPNKQSLPIKYWIGAVEVEDSLDKKWAPVYIAEHYGVVHDTSGRHDQLEYVNAYWNKPNQDMAGLEPEVLLAQSESEKSRFSTVRDFIMSRILQHPIR